MTIGSPRIDCVDVRHAAKVMLYFANSAERTRRLIEQDHGQLAQTRYSSIGGAYENQAFLV